MIIYRGRGFLVAVIAFACLMLAELYTRAQYHDDTYYQRQGWPKLAAFLIAAFIVWVLTSRREEVVGVAAQNEVAKRSLFKPQDSLFFVPVKHWPLILCGLGVIFYFVRDL